MLFWVLKSAVVFLVAGLATWGMRRRSAALRHLVWVWAFVVVGLMPLAAAVVPQRVVPTSVPVYRSVTSVAEHLPSALVPKEVRSQEEVTLSVAHPRSEANPWWVVYGLGLSAGVVRLLLALAKLRRVARLGTPVPGAEPSVHRVAGLAVPITFGQRRPVILLPEDSDRWDPARLEVVIRHERAHVVRRDWVWQCLALGICVAQWFNPLVWWAFRCLRLEAERATDDQVLEQGISSSLYAQTLLDFSRGQVVGGLATLPMARKSGLSTRIHAITRNAIDRSRPSARIRRVLSLAATLTCGLLASAAVSFAVPDELLWPTNLPLASEEIEIYAPWESNSAPIKLVAVQRSLKDGGTEAWDAHGERQPVTIPVPTQTKLSDLKVRWVILAGPEVSPLDSPDYVILGHRYDSKHQRTILNLGFRPELRTGIVRVVSVQAIPRKQSRKSARIPDEVWKQPFSLLEGSVRVAESLDSAWITSIEDSASDLDLVSWPEPYVWSWTDQAICRIRLSHVTLDPLPVDQYSADATGIVKLARGLKFRLASIREGEGNAPQRVWGHDGGAAYALPFPKVYSYGGARNPEVIDRDVLWIINGLNGQVSMEEPHFRVRSSDAKVVGMSKPSKLTSEQAWLIGKLSLSSSIRKTDLSLGIASGAWRFSETIQVKVNRLRPLRVLGIIDRTPVGQANFHLPERLKSKDLKIVLYDATGHPIPVLNSVEQVTSSADLHVLMFSLLPKRIPAYVKISTREYRWVDFANVAMQPTVN